MGTLEKVISPYLITGFLLIILSCSGSKNLGTEDYEVIHYKGKTIHGTKELKQHYTLEVPKKADLTKEYGIGGDPYFVEYRLTYSDSSVIYISNNTWGGSYLNYKNRIGKSLHADGITDSIVNEGIQKDGHYWKEAIIRDIVVGYVNADESKKMAFDKSMQTLRPVQRK